VNAHDDVLVPDGAIGAMKDGRSRGINTLAEVRNIRMREVSLGGVGTRADTFIRGLGG